jgi:hypothetical protein
MDWKGLLPLRAPGLLDLVSRHCEALRACPKAKLLIGMAV